MTDAHPYSTRAYAESLAHVGRAIEVQEWGTHVVARQIPAGGEDVIGCYPITVMPEIVGLLAGLRRLRDAGMVSVALVLDDFHRPSVAMLEAAFDSCVPFKTHYVHLGPSGRYGREYLPHKNHRTKIKHALREVHVEVINLADHMDAWCAMYEGLVRHHCMQGVHDFPRASFEAQARIPGMEAIGGFVAGELVCVNTWAVHECRAHSHLVASTEFGYKTRAAYAVTDFAMRHYGVECDVVNLGGAAGTADAGDGLAQFKKGFSNSTARSYLCCSILDEDAYWRLAEGKQPGAFFPAYRAIA